MTAIAEALKPYEADEARRNKRLAFFTGDIVDLSADTFRKEALLFADELRSNPDEDWIRINKDGLNDAIKGVDDKIIDRYRTLILKFPLSLSEQLYSDIELVTEDYGSSNDNGFQVVHIPMEKVTGHKSLPYPHSSTDYHPKLNLRVQTSTNPPLQIYSGPGQVCEEPSSGRWISLPFEMIEIATIL